MELLSEIVLRGCVYFPGEACAVSMPDAGGRTLAAVAKSCVVALSMHVREILDRPRSLEAA
jgi:hypothetical protein